LSHCSPRTEERHNQGQKGCFEITFNETVLLKKSSDSPWLLMPLSGLLKGTGPSADLIRVYNGIKKELFKSVRIKYYDNIDQNINKF
jgi:hypothetical protein